MSISHIDFDGKPLQLVEDAYRQARDFQYAINNQCKRDWLLYRAFVDMTNRDNTLPHISLPKLYSIIEQKTAQDVKALLGMRPYIPLESKRKEFRYMTDIIEELLDEYLSLANFYSECIPLFKIKTMSGAGFMEFLPEYEMRTETKMIVNSLGLPDVTEQEVPRFRLRCRMFAPWEVFVDPFATNMETPEGCRYVVKLVLTSKRKIQKIQERGGYPDLDIEKLNHNNAGVLEQEHWGKQMLDDFGLNLPTGDDDIGVLMRYESADRYVDVWNGTVPLRDVPNPYVGQGRFKGHGGINLARIIHVQDAHTQNRIWGIGEVKPNEVQAEMLNDLWNAVFRREQFAGEPLIFYRNNDVEVDDLYWEMSNRIPVKGHDGRPITDSFHIHSGQELPRDQFNLISSVERNIDMTSQTYGPLRGEMSKSDTTATEIAQIRETGSERQELIIKTAEQIFLKSVGRICLGHINQFATPDDYAEIVGVEKASVMFTAHPGQIPGGFDFRFKGSNRVANLLIKQRNMKELAPILIQLFNDGQFEMARNLLETYEIPTDEIEAIITQNMQLFRFKLGMQMASAQAQAQIPGGNPGGKYKENNQKQIAQGNARTLRGDA